MKAIGVRPKRASGAADRVEKHCAGGRRVVGPRRMGRIVSAGWRADTAELQGFVAETVEPGGAVHGWNGGRVSRLGASGATTMTRNVCRCPTVAVAVLPRVHLLFSLLKRWLLSTHQGAVRHRHLDYYLERVHLR